jgi:colanic acid biosynthesis glycosyl transferase WcaI
LKRKLAMRVLLLSIYFPPEIGANSRIVDGLSKELCRLGDEVTVVTDLPHYPAGRVRPGYQGKLHARERHGDRFVIRNWLVVGSRESRWLRIANNLSFALSGIVGGLSAGRQDVIYVYSPPLFLGLTAFLLGRLKRIPYVFNVQDIYPEIAVQYGVIRNKTLIRLLEGFESWVYRKAAHVTVISEGSERSLVAKGVPAEKITVVPNWVESDLFELRPKDNPFSREYGLDSRFVIMYAGNIGYSQGLETVVEAARLLHNEPGIRFMVVGDGVKRQSLVNLVESFGLDNIAFAPYQPRERMPDVLASADACMVILTPDKSKTTIQSKTYEIMAMQRPIIASVDLDGDNWKLIAEAGAGLWVRPGDPGALAEKVSFLYDKREVGVRLGQNGRRYVERHNTLEIVGELYQALLHRVAEQARAT